MKLALCDFCQPEKIFTGSEGVNGRLLRCVMSGGISQNLFHGHTMIRSEDKLGNRNFFQFSKIQTWISRKKRSILTYFQNSKNFFFTAVCRKKCLRYALKKISVLTGSVVLHRKNFSDQYDKNCAINSEN